MTAAQLCLFDEVRSLNDLPRASGPLHRRHAHTLHRCVQHGLVAILTPPGPGRGVSFISRCACGWESPRCRLESLARKAHLEHVEKGKASSDSARTVKPERRN